MTSSCDWVIHDHAETWNWDRYNHSRYWQIIWWSYFLLGLGGWFNNSTRKWLSHARRPRHICVHPLWTSPKHTYGVMHWKPRIVTMPTFCHWWHHRTGDCRYDNCIVMITSDYRLGIYKLRNSHCGDKTIYGSLISTKGFPILVRRHLCTESGPLFTKKTSSYGYRDPHYKPKTVWRPSQVYNGNPYTDKTASS